MRFGVITAVWKRPALTALCLRRVANAAQASKHEVLLHAVVSEPDAELMARWCGWNTIVHENKPFGAKWNAATKSLRGTVDAVVVIGSDAWISDGCFEVYADLIEQGVRYIGTPDHYYMRPVPDRETMRLEAVRWGGYQNHRRGEPIGDGRVLHAELLDSLNWAICDYFAPRALDGSMTAKIRDSWEGKSRVATLEELGIMLFSTKTATNMNPWESISHPPEAEPVAPELVLSHFPEFEVSDYLDMLKFVGCDRDLFLRSLRDAAVGPRS